MTSRETALIRMLACGAFDYLIAMGLGLAGLSLDRRGDISDENVSGFVALRSTVASSTVPSGSGEAFAAPSERPRWPK